MSKRKTALESAQKKDQVVDFSEILAADAHSLKGLAHEEEGKLMQVEKDIKGFLANKDLTLGAEFVTLFERKEAIERRIELIKKVQEYVNA